MFLNDWKGKGLEDIVDDFEIEMSELEGVNILLASYGYEEYEGDAFVLFEKGGKLYEINGSHCSCHGLESDSYNGGPTQWQPEETGKESLLHRLNEGFLGNKGDINEFAEELRSVLSSL